MIDPNHPMIDEVENLPAEAVVEVSRATTWDGWYASLSRPVEGLGRFFEFDFTMAADTREEAIERCFTVIKEDLRTGGNSHFNGVDLLYLLQHWKNRAADLKNDMDP